MGGVTQASPPMVLDRAVPARGVGQALLYRVALPVATMLSIGGISLLLLLSPIYLHPALDAAGSAAWLGMTTDQAHSYSDKTVGELVFGPGTFDFAGANGSPFFDTDERGHMRDVRVVLYVFLAVAALSVVGLALAGARTRASARFAQAVAGGGLALVVGTIVLGAFAAIAFDAAFELFHELLFPGGNFTFDPTHEHLVQLYPEAFWQMTAAALGTLLIAGGALTWLVARRRAARARP